MFHTYYGSPQLEHAPNLNQILNEVIYHNPKFLITGGSGLVGLYHH